MGQEHGARRPSKRARSPRGLRLTVFCDYRPFMDERDEVLIVLPSEWGEPKAAHEAILELLETSRTLELVDNEGQTWTFNRQTVRSFSVSWLED